MCLLSSNCSNWMVFQKIGTMYHIIAFHSRNTVCALINNRPLATATLFNLILYFFNLSHLLALSAGSFPPSFLSLLFLSSLPSFSCFSSISSSLKWLYYPSFSNIHSKLEEQDFYQLMESVFWTRNHSSIPTFEENGNYRSFSGTRNAIEYERGHIQRIILFYCGNRVKQFCRA